ncbi:MAG: hypothetical protein MZV65_48850 [Chromatiales bacterium]|nr:hypothetical protein [Chromatiales bacterium]
MHAGKLIAAGVDPVPGLPAAPSPRPSPTNRETLAAIQELSSSLVLMSRRQRRSPRPRSNGLLDEWFEIEFTLPPDSSAAPRRIAAAAARSEQDFVLTWSKRIATISIEIAYRFAQMRAGLAGAHGPARDRGLGAARDGRLRPRRSARGHPGGGSRWRTSSSSATSTPPAPFSTTSAASCSPSCAAFRAGACKIEQADSAYTDTETLYLPAVVAQMRTRRRTTSRCARPSSRCSGRRPASAPSAPISPRHSRRLCRTAARAAAVPCAGDAASGGLHRPRAAGPGTGDGGVCAPRRAESTCRRTGRRTRRDAWRGRDATVAGHACALLAAGLCRAAAGSGRATRANCGSRRRPSAWRRGWRRRRSCCA